MNEFFKRTFTGIFIVIFVLGGFWLHPVSFFITGLVILSCTQYEYYRLIIKTGINPQMIPGLIAGITAYTVSTLAAAGKVDLRWILILVPIIILIIVAELYRSQERPFDSLAHTLFPLLYIALPFSLMPHTAFSHQGLTSLLRHNTEFSPGIVIGFLLLLWTNDTVAYLVGITLGRHRLFEKVSPKKSWEGFFGGMAFTILVGYLISGWLGIIGVSGWIIVAVIISISGTYGDLAESMLKRSAGLKDSGSIMPGHGGFLDRFDGVLISFPIVYLYFMLFG
ncbi:MAG TPA: phosphatidate cytidylyltransferase [Bacteroidales bacterium]|nr:phosphatidate cytidylyltransferase [Bacteroidales bacterium]HOK73669.1 phosphatidate cytidylyltransferase [Bacteroidales bacterium]HOM39335.1 phosphatidate cytidylyltransferase [Bacteroidales bacterium]HPP91443.1 phosphatidate cytidylyltransferase [Bacteroidales bacterium]HQG56465.1 phosphatidate cytidylyltransferase [Bacteroidales bacterium]